MSTAQRIHLHDRATIEAFLRRDVWLNLYHLGDLDDEFWPHTTWYGSREGGELAALALLYSGLTLPCLLALSGGETRALADLLRALPPVLPARLYCHLTPGVEPALAEAYELVSHGPHLKMALRETATILGADSADGMPHAQHADANSHGTRSGAGDRASALSEVDAGDVVPLNDADAEEGVRFYEASYPGHWFEPQMLATGCYFGRRVAGVLVCVAGVHVHSPSQRVAALGNITTHPAHRGQGHARATTARLCQHLMQTCDHIGLNVKADNAAAIRCYARLGFEVVAEYEEYAATLRGLPD